MHVCLCATVRVSQLDKDPVALHMKHFSEACFHFGGPKHFAEKKEIDVQIFFVVSAKPQLLLEVQESTA